MGLIRLYVAVSLDGYIASADGGVAWLDAFKPPDDYGYASFIDGIRRLVMGRATYDQAIGFGPWPYGSRPTVVLTSGGLSSVPEGADVVPLNAEALCRELNTPYEGDTWVVGGGRTLTLLLDHGLVDRLELYVMPVLLGDGIPLFEARPGRAPAPLRLVSSRAFPDGVLETIYTVDR